MMETTHLTKVYIHLERMTHNLQILQELVGNKPMWPAIKANAYGHGMEIIARHLVSLGYNILCVAHLFEAVYLIEKGIAANYILLSASLPKHAKAIVSYGCEPVLCNLEMARALAREAEKANKVVAAHLMVDTGMGRIGIQPHKVAKFLDQCRDLPALQLRSLMSHFPCAGEKDNTLSLQQLECFRRVIKTAKPYGIEQYHMANSAAIFDLPDAYFDAVRPGISIFGLRPTWGITNPQVEKLQPVLEWKSQITYLKQVAAGTGLSYGHIYHTTRPALIATVPIGYGDGLSRNLSNTMDVLIRGIRCPQVGRITMDQSLVDVTALSGEVCLGDEVVILGRQGSEIITADELAEKLATINYEIVTQINQRVPRVPLIKS